MYYLNLGHRWNVLSSASNVRGVVLLPCGNSSAKLIENRVPEVQQVLLDPQIYLATLNPAECGTTCGRLVSYPWFQNYDNLPQPFDSARGNRRAWEQSLKATVSQHWRAQLPRDDEQIRRIVREAISFQRDIACTQVILPAPLLTEREDEGATAAAWLDAGIEVADELGIEQPLLATVAMSEGVLNSTAFGTNGFLDTVVDQVATRDGLSGVYIVVAQTRARHPFEADPIVYHAYLHLCRAFGRLPYDTVLPNFVDLFGLACVSVGATGVASGTAQARRRLALGDFGDGGGGGRNLPHFYTHRLIAELLTETDLPHFVEKRMLARINDRTPHSEALLIKLREGGSASDLPTWAESHMNTNFADRHFVFRFAHEVAALLRADSASRIERVREWLESAAANALLVQRRLGAEIGGRVAPSETWLDILNDQTDL